MFIFFFALFIFIFTVWENLFIGLICLSCCFLIHSLVARKNILKNTGILLLGFCCAGFSVWRFNHRYNGLSGPSSLSGLNVFIGTGQVLDRQGHGKYLIKNGNFTYLLASQSDYQIADQLRIVGNIKGVKSVNLVELRSQFTQLTQFTQFTGLFHYSFNYDKRLKMKGIQGTIFEQNSIQLSSLSGPSSRISSLRIGLQSMVKNSYGNGKTAGLVLGMLIGDKSQIPKSDYQSFIDSGLVHLIAVSGGNIIMIVVFLGFILLRVPFYFRNFIILLCIITYGFLCGMDSSVFRAVIMGGLGMVALFRGRQLDIWRSLSLAFIGMLLVNPYYLVYDVGFLFSFSAIIGLIYFNTSQLGKISKTESTENQVHSVHQVYRIRKSWSYLWQNYLSPSIGATLGILPTMIFFMGKINLLGVIGNLLVLPIVPFVMIYGFISTVLYKIFPRSGFLHIEERLIRYIYRVSEQVGNFGFYMNVEGDRIKYLILTTAIIWFVRKRIKSGETQENTVKQEMEKSKVGSDELFNS